MQELCELLIDDDADIRSAIKGCLLKQPFRLICHRLLHQLDDDSLLGFLNGILGQSYSQQQLQQPASADAALPQAALGNTAWASQQLEQLLQLLIFGCIRWRSLEQMLMHVALAFHSQQLQRGMQSSDKFQVCCPF